MTTRKSAVSMALGLALLVGLCSGCGNSGTVIPLADVPDPPKLPTQKDGAAKPPPGASPTVLPN